MAQWVMSLGIWVAIHSTMSKLGISGCACDLSSWVGGRQESLRCFLSWSQLKQWVPASLRVLASNNKAENDSGRTDPQTLASTYATWVNPSAHTCAHMQIPYTHTHTHKTSSKTWSDKHETNAILIIRHQRNCVFFKIYFYPSVCMLHMLCMLHVYGCS